MKRPNFKNLKLFPINNLTQKNGEVRSNCQLENIIVAKGKTINTSHKIENPTLNEPPMIFEEKTKNGIHFPADVSKSELTIRLDSKVYGGAGACPYDCHVEVGGEGTPHELSLDRH